MEQQDWSAAIATLQKAIGYHPQYAAAYNNLGVVYARIGDRNNEAAALQHAIDVDRRYAPAYVNLARMDIATSRFPEASTFSSVGNASCARLALPPSPEKPRIPFPEIV